MLQRLIATAVAFILQFIENQVVPDEGSNEDTKLERSCASTDRSHGVGQRRWTGATV